MKLPKENKSDYESEDDKNSAVKSGNKVTFFTIFNMTFYV